MHDTEQEEAEKKLVSSRINPYQKRSKCSNPEVHTIHEAAVVVKEKRL